jgi:hypothetical protein
MKLPIVHLPGFFLCSGCGAPVLGDLTGEHVCIDESYALIKLLDNEQPAPRRPRGRVYKHCS